MAEVILVVAVVDEATTVGVVVDVAVDEATTVRVVVAVDKLYQRKQLTGISIAVWQVCNQ